MRVTSYAASSGTSRSDSVLPRAQQRAGGVLAPPGLARARLPVPEYDDRAGPAAHPERLGEALPVVLVGQPLARLVEGHPGDVVDLVVGAVAAHVVVAHDPAGPVVDGLHPLPDRVPLGLQRWAEAHVQAGLLGHLADGGGDGMLAAVQLALGERPVVVLRAMDEKHLTTGTECDHAGGENVGHATRLVTHEAVPPPLARRRCGAHRRRGRAGRAVGRARRGPEPARDGARPRPRVEPALLLDGLVGRARRARRGPVGRLVGGRRRRLPARCLRPRPQQHHRARRVGGDHAGGARLLTGHDRLGAVRPGRGRGGDRDGAARGPRSRSPARPSPRCRVRRARRLRRGVRSPAPTSWRRSAGR